MRADKPGVTRELGHLANGGDRCGLVLDDEPRQPVLDDSGTDPRLKAITGVPQAIASIMTRPNGSASRSASAKRPPRRGSPASARTPHTTENQTGERQQPPPVPRFQSEPRDGHANA